MKLRSRIKWLQEKVFRPGREFLCPLCGYTGLFIVTNNRSLGRRYYSQCPECSAKERHRLMAFVLDKLLSIPTAKNWNALHFAPENPLRKMVETRVANYSTSNFTGGGDFKLDISNINLSSQSYDLVIASHVLEHVEHEQRALNEIHRILRPGGYAILPVPIYSENTIEYGKPLECGGHWRAPGPDYFERLRKVFAKVTVTASSDAPVECQTYCLECRSQWPTRTAPLVKPMRGFIFQEFVPVCQV